MKVVAIVQARMGSSRLPGKVLKSLGSTTNLEYLLTRLRQSKLIDQVLVATSDCAEDDEIQKYCEKIGVNVFRGPENDCLTRYILAAQSVEAQVIIRVTGDCPLVDPRLVDDCVRELLERGCDYISNCNGVSNPLPDGFDVEVFTLSSLLQASDLSIVDAYREHVTFAYINTGLFRIGRCEYQHNFQHLRLTLDYEEDLKVLTALASVPEAENMGWRELSKIAVENKLHSINGHFIRNASWDKSFEGVSNPSGRIKKRSDLIAHESGLLSKRADQFSPGGWPENYIVAKGQTIFTEDRRVFLDYSIGGIGATTLGYARNEIDDSVVKAVRRGSASSLNSYLELEASEKLREFIPWADLFRFTRSGGEAATMAIRLGRAASGKDGVLFSGYHGWHDWYLAAGFDHKLGNHLLDKLPISGIPRCLRGTSAPFEYGNYDDFELKLNSLGAEIGVVIMEPMRYQNPDKEFLAHVAKRCSEKSIALIFDEISSGFRFENGLASSSSGVKPDAVVLSKALGNGYAIAAVAGRHSFMSAAKDSFISSTTHTESVGFAAMSAVLDFYSQNDVASVLGERGAAVKNILKCAGKAGNININIKGLDQLWTWSFGVDSETERYLQTICTELMLSRSILFSNRVYATLGMLDTNLPLLENALNDTFIEIGKLLSTGKDLGSAIKYLPNKLGIY